MLLKDLENFISICENNTLSETSEKNFISQPGLSRTLHRLEIELNTSLILRSRGVKNIELTNHGKWLYHKAKQISDINQKIKDHFKGSLINPNISIFISPPCAAYTLKNEVNDLMKYGYVSSDEFSYNTQLEEFKKSNCSLGFVESSKENLEAWPFIDNYYIYALRKDDIGIVVNLDHPLLEFINNDSVLINKLHQFKLLKLPPSNPIGEISLYYEKLYKMETQQISDMQTIKTLVSNTNNIALLTENKIGPRKDIKLIPLPSNNLFVYSYFLVNKKANVNKNIMQHIESLLIKNRGTGKWLFNPLYKEAKLTNDDIFERDFLNFRGD